MTDSMGPGKLVRHMQNLSYTYNEYLICIRLGPSISSVICKNLSYSGPSYPSSPVHLNKFVFTRQGIHFGLVVTMPSRLASLLDPHYWVGLVAI